MFAFNLINKQLNSFVMLLIIVIFSEVCTSTVSYTHLTLPTKRIV